MATRLHNNHLKSKDDGNKEVDNSPASACYAGNLRYKRVRWKPYKQ
jgi:hypothetical protein